MNTTYAQELIAYVAVAVGHGTKSHLVELKQHADGSYEQAMVSCGSRQQTTWGRSRQWGNELLTEFFTRIDWFAVARSLPLGSAERDDVLQSLWTATLPNKTVALDKFIEFAGDYACTKCVKQTQDSIKFMSGKVAA